MLEILTGQQIRKWDAFTIAHEPIESIDLMERACKAFLTWFTSTFPNTSGRVGVVCGQGNNGGDGLGIARLLSQCGYLVEVWAVANSPSGTKDFESNKKRLPNSVAYHAITNKEASNEAIFHDCTLLIDALFGSGLSRPIIGLYATIIQRINDAPATRIAVDIPSGLFPESPSSGAIVRAHHTVSFQVPKLAFLLPENAPYVGTWTTVDIGLKKAYLDTITVSHFLITGKTVRKYIPKRPKYAHKGTFGHALIIAGSKGKMGACILASRAAVRAGAGLLTTHVPQEGYPIMQTAVPEAMLSIDLGENCFTSCPATTPYSVVAVGPGLGQAPETARVLADLLKSFRRPMVIDADALNLLATHREWLPLIPEGSLLTPHPGELARLTGTWKNDVERLHKAQQLAQQTKAIVILKGAHTAICAPDGKTYFNTTGNPGMATGGSGDVLTGILAGLLSSQLPPLKAALSGVYLHGLAGDLGAKQQGQQALIASDIIDYLPRAFCALADTTP